MRFVVEYTKPGQIPGARMFDVQGARDTWEVGVRRAAEQVAGPGALIVRIRKMEE